MQHLTPWPAMATFTLPCPLITVFIVLALAFSSVSSAQVRASLLPIACLDSILRCLSSLSFSRTLKTSPVSVSCLPSLFLYPSNCYSHSTDDLIFRRKGGQRKKIPQGPTCYRDAHLHGNQPYWKSRPSSLQTTTLAWQVPRASPSPW